MFVKVLSMKFAQRRNRLRTHFSERILVVKRRMSVQRKIVELTHTKTHTCTHTNTNTHIDFNTGAGYAALELSKGKDYWAADPSNPLPQKQN